jgi:hypothetical protein
MLTLVAGEGGDGKSQLSCLVAAAVSTGGTFPDGTRAPLGRVIILAAEDSASRTIIPRLAAAGADLANVDILVATVTVRDDEGRQCVHPRSLEDLGYWQAVLTRGDAGQPAAALFVVDTLPGLMKGVNDFRNNEVRGLMEPFIEQVIDPLGVAVLGITHLNKSVDQRTPTHKILGSVAYPNLARSVFCTCRGGEGDVDDQGREWRYLFHVKVNVGEEQPTLRYVVEKVELGAEGTGRVIRTARLVFHPDPVALSARDLMGGNRRQAGGGRKPTESMKDAGWLFDRLAGNGWVRLATLIDEAVAQGILTRKKDSDKVTTTTPLYRARDAVADLPEPRAGRSVVVKKMSDPVLTFGGKTTSSRRYPYWRLSGPEDVAPTDPGVGP